MTHSNGVKELRAEEPEWKEISRAPGLTVNFLPGQWLVCPKATSTIKGTF